MQGSCVGWAVAYIVKTYHERIERGWPLTDDRHVMSPAYIYNQIKVPGGGAYFVDAFILLVNEGVSSWEQMPYDEFDDQSQPSASARAEANNYKIADWGTVLRNTHAVFVQEIKRHLAAGTPLVVGIPVYPDFDSLNESNPVYDDTRGTQRGGHAVVIVGYDDRRSAFKIANSWGTDWGIGGYGWIDYDASERLIWEIYVTEDVVASPDDEPPGAASDPRPGNTATSVALDTVLRWTRNARTTSFDVYLGTDANLRANDFQGSVARAEFTPHLAPGSRYYWRIDARGTGGITQGPVWAFTTAGVLEEPGKATNPSPAHGATRVPQNTELRWDSGGRATSYDVYLGTDPRLGTNDLQQTQAARTYYPRGLQPGTRYYWRIDATNGQGTTTGDVWTFTTAQTQEQDTDPVLPSIGNKTYTTGTPVTEMLPAATGGNGGLTYGLTPSIPGLTFDAGTRSLYGTPRQAGTYHMRYRVQDVDGDTDSQSFTVTVRAREPDTSPVLPPIGDRAYPAGDYVSERLPAATGGNGSLAYSLTPTIPGLTFDAGTRSLYGTPWQAGTYHMRYRVQDVDGDTDSQSFTVAVQAREPDTSPVLPPIGDRAYPAGDYVSERLPAATGGNGSLAYSLTPTIPGLTFDAGTRSLYGTPWQAGTYHMRYRVQDVDGDTDSQSFTVAVQARKQDTSPVLPSISDKTYTVGVAIAPWNLPSATGGDSPLTYNSQGWPPGITSRHDRVSGTPTVAGTFVVTYTVADQDGDTDTLSFTIVVVAAPDPESLPQDFLVLLSIKDALIGDGDPTLNWSADIPLASWTGVSVGEDRIVALDLRVSFDGTDRRPHRDLSGTIPAAIGNLSQLRSLDLRSNTLSGTIPDELGRLSRLKRLLLSGNDFSGTIPGELGRLSRLQYLYLNHNDLSGTIPGELGNLSHLEWLEMYGNDLSGGIPATLGSLSQLRTLDLGGNDLSGTIPSGLGNLSQLQYMDLSHNDLIGTIPGELGNLSQLQSLHLYMNRLNGCIPATLSRFQGGGGSGINSQQGGRNLPLCGG